MKAKKKFLFITSMLLLVALMSCMLAGCKSAEEKEREYYAKAQKSVGERVQTLNTLTADVFSKSWTANFMYSFTYYANKDKDGNVITDCNTRGDDKHAGWQSDSKEYVHFMYFEVKYKNESNYTIKTTTFEDTDRKNYFNNKNNVKNYDKKFKKTGTLKYELKDGVASGSLAEDFNPLEYIKANTDGNQIIQNGLSATDDFKVYTHFMRIETRKVYDKDRAVITREFNDENNKAYWSGFGDDISYNWKEVYSIDNNRLTVLYNKGKKRINSLEIYNEEIISYYVQKDKVNKQLVLKADVIRYHEMVVEFEYA